MNTQKELTDKIIPFLNEIGIEVLEGEIEGETFVPGIRIEKGKIIYDPGKMLYPGDLLHEAGHIAVMLPEERQLLSGDVKEGVETDAMGDELGAILWSFAASKHIDLPLNVVFHPAGYRGASEWYIENFQNGTYIALPLLVWMGMTLDPETATPDTKPFPHMIRWMRS